MRLRALVLVCLVVAALSGVALFTPFSRMQGGWLDALFLVAVLVLLVVALRAVSLMAERSMSDAVDPDRNDGGDTTWRNR